MQQNILCTGLDVDDTRYHASAQNQGTGETPDFKCRPSPKGLLNQLDKLANREESICWAGVHFGRSVVVEIFWSSALTQEKGK